MFAAQSVKLFRAACLGAAMIGLLARPALAASVAAGEGELRASAPVGVLNDRARALAVSMAPLYSTFRAPLLDTPVTSGFGWRVSPAFKRRMFHAGVDYAASEGTPIHAAQDGLVIAMEGRRNAGFYVRMRHGHGIETAYAHLLRFMPGLHSGSFLRRGDVLGFVGATGDATGPHLHYEVILQGIPVDPVSLKLRPAM